MHRQPFFRRRQDKRLAASKSVASLKKQHCGRKSIWTAEIGETLREKNREYNRMASAETLAAFVEPSANTIRRQFAKDDWIERRIKPRPRGILGDPRREAR